MDWILNRRAFLQVAAMAGISATALLTGGCQALLDKIRNRRVRRDINSLSPTDPILQTFRDAVAAMKALPSSDPRNWEAQAKIHLEHCPHGNWYFLPWHRAYLRYFEEICQELTGNNDFALPYWNWSTHPQVPPVFWDTSSSLYHPGRTATSGSTASSASVGPSVISSILSLTNFELFASAKPNPLQQRVFAAYGHLEATPHNYIHVFVGGDMATYWSPRDPVFWTHHNMVDCLWAEWNIGLGNPNTNDPDWTQFTFPGNFVARNGNSVDVKVIETLLYLLFVYRFDGRCQAGAGEAPSAPALRRIQWKDRELLRKFLEEGADTRYQVIQRASFKKSVRLPVKERITVRRRLPAVLLQSPLTREDRRAILRIGAVQLPRYGDFVVNVFINKPDANAATPATDPHFAGSFAFFGTEHARHGGARPDYLVDLTRTIRRLGLSPRQRGELTVTLVPVPIHEGRVRDRELDIGQVELLLTDVPQVKFRAP